MKTPPSPPAFFPVTGSERVVFIDALRGFALFGVLMANLPLFSGIYFLEDEQADAMLAAPANQATHFAIELLFDNKFIGLFSLLFGLGFAIQLTRAQQKKAPHTAIYLRRAALLLLIGLAHGFLLWLGDILRFYAFMGASLLLLSRLRPRTLLLAGVLVGVVIPAIGDAVLYSIHEAANAAAKAQGLPEVESSASPGGDTFEVFRTGGYFEMLAQNWKADIKWTFQWDTVPWMLMFYGRFLIGFWAGMTRFYHEPERFRRAHVMVVAIGIPFGLLANVVYAFEYEIRDAVSGTWIAWPVEALAYTGFIALTMAYASALLLLWQTGLRRWLGLLAPVGQMALTNYLAQTLICVFLFYGFPGGPNLMGKTEWMHLPLFCAAIFAIQIGWSGLWLRRFRFGPAEWAWRCATYGRFQPITRTPPPLPGATL